MSYSPLHDKPNATIYIVILREQIYAKLDTRIYQTELSKPFSERRTERSHEAWGLYHDVPAPSRPRAHALTSWIPRSNSASRSVAVPLLLPALGPQFLIRDTDPGVSGGGAGSGGRAPMLMPGMPMDRPMPECVPLMPGLYPRMPGFESAHSRILPSGIQP